jgi:hypothetical protein
MAMVLALEVNVALWVMIGCVAMRTIQLIM